MHIGVVPETNAAKGGSHQYSMLLVDALGHPALRNQGHQWSLILMDGHPTQVNSASWRTIRLPLFSRERATTLVERIAGDGWMRDAAKVVANALALQQSEVQFAGPPGRMNRLVGQEGIELLFHTVPSSRIFGAGVPYVVPIFDLQHRLQPQFPEVSAYGEAERRERLYRRLAQEATLIIADSEVGREDVLECYAAHGATEDRVKVLPYLPPPYMYRNVTAAQSARIRAQLRLPERYLLYPAQFWPHKNHIRIVQALGQQGIGAGSEIHVFFSGGHNGMLRTRTFKEVMHEARRLGVERQVHYVGRVPNESMPCLYQGAAGLVMPTFFGPTNIPVVEAWLWGCAVLTSDIRGIREQVGDAGLLVDPRSPDAIGDGMRRLWDDSELRERLAARGREHLSKYGLDEFRGRLSQIVDEAADRIDRSPVLATRSVALAKSIVEASKC